MADLYSLPIQSRHKTIYSISDDSHKRVPQHLLLHIPYFSHTNSLIEITIQITGRTSFTIISNTSFRRNNVPNALQSL